MRNNTHNAHKLTFSERGFVYVYCLSDHAVCLAEPCFMSVCVYSVLLCYSMDITDQSLSLHTLASSLFVIKAVQLCICARFRDRVWRVCDADSGEGRSVWKGKQAAQLQNRDFPGRTRATALVRRTTDSKCCSMSFSLSGLSAHFSCWV